MTMENATIKLVRVAKYSKAVEVPGDVVEQGKEAIWEWLADHE